MEGIRIRRGRHFPLHLPDPAGRLLLPVHVRLQETPRGRLARGGLELGPPHKGTNGRIHEAVPPQHRDALVPGLRLAVPDHSGGPIGRAPDCRLVGPVHRDHSLVRDAVGHLLHGFRGEGGLPPGPRERCGRTQIGLAGHALYHGRQHCHGGLFSDALSQGQFAGDCDGRRERGGIGQKTGPRHAGEYLSQPSGQQRNLGHLLGTGTTPDRHRLVVRIGIAPLHWWSGHLHPLLSREPHRSVLVGGHFGGDRDCHCAVFGGDLGLGKVCRRRARATRGCE
mmetsp:Transcript_7038/g.17671  ORF Transcript_7038/g.17671 Transcript_7038/m.17671 type:complete len:280 (+) Transcript_7038:372-1211(+)